MSGFEQLPQAIDEGVALNPPTEDEVAFYDEELSDEEAVGLVLRDKTAAEQYLQSKSLITAMDRADDLVRAYVKPRTWPQTDTPRANLGMPLILETIEKLMPELFLALWGNTRQPFVLEATGKTKPEAARVRGKVLAWAIKESGLKEQMRLTLKNALTYGFVVGQWGWEQKERKVKKYERANDGSGRIVRKETTELINIPFYRVCDMRGVLVDPGCNTQDVRKSAKFIINQTFITANDLDDLRDLEGYKNIPTREELATILANKGEEPTDSLQASKPNVWRDLQAEQPKNPTSSDPLLQPLELLEWTSDDRVITVLNSKICIRNEQNEFDKKNFVSCAFIDVINSAWGFGVAKLLAGEQLFQQGVANAWIDALALILNPVYQMIKGIGAGTEQIKISPGKVLNPTGELKPLLTPSITPEALGAIENSEQRAYRRVGANGGSGMPNPAMRTAEGVQAFSGDIIKRLQYFLDIFAEMVFLPVLEAFIEMCNDRLTHEQINSILTEADGKAYEGDILEVYNATSSIDVLATTKLTAKVAAAQLVPMIINLISTEAVQDSLTAQGKKFDYVELFDEALELMGWDLDSLFVPMTPQDQQRAMIMNEAASRMIAAQQVEQQKHQNDLDTINEKGIVQAGVAIVKQAVKGHMDQAEAALGNMNNPQVTTNGQ